MKRLFWLGIGLAVGAVVARKVARAAAAYSPQGLAGAARDSVADAIAAVRDFIMDVREGMAEREEQIRAAFVEGRALDEFAEPDWLGTDDKDGMRTGR